MTDSTTSLRVAIAGASGLIGSALSAHLQKRGITVSHLVRPGSIHSDTAEVATIAWDPSGGTIDQQALRNTDVVIHLGGANIAKHWTSKRKALIRDSRVISTRFLSTTLAEMDDGPRTLLCASAVGFYGNRGDEILTEDSAAGDGFLPDVVQAWEAATSVARDADIRVVNLRMGLVLSQAGGALATMLPVFRLGLGGVLGSGRQFVNWITLHDLVRAIAFLLDRNISGPVNLVSPQPVDNRAFTRMLGRVVRRPTIVPVPAAAIGLLLGDMGKTLLLSSNRVLPTRLEEFGFDFVHPDLESGLRHELGWQVPQAGSPRPRDGGYT